MANLLKNKISSQYDHCEPLIGGCDDCLVALLELVGAAVPVVVVAVAAAVALLYE